MSDLQREHALAVERLAPRLAALRAELCPEHMMEGCFRKIYFELLCPILSLHDTELLSTPQITDSRKDTEVISEMTEQHQLVSSSKGKILWKKVKYQLVEYHSLPGYLRDNKYILRHYRSEWPLKQALLSIFSIHNETLNVWTHLIGFFLFLSLTMYTAMNVPKVDLHSLQLPEVLKADLHKLQECLPSLPSMPNMQRLREALKMFPSLDLLPSLSGWHIMDFLSNCLPGRLFNGNRTDVCVLEDEANLIAPLTMSPIRRWPFFTFLGGAMFCLLGISTCHLLSCHSEHMSYIMLRIDYCAGIATPIATSFYPPVYYSMFITLYCQCFIRLNSEASEQRSSLEWDCLIYCQFCTSRFCSGTNPRHCTQQAMKFLWEFCMELERLLMLREYQNNGCQESSTLPPTVSCICSSWGLHSLTCRSDLPQVAQPQRMLAIKIQSIDEFSRVNRRMLFITIG